MPSTSTTGKTPPATKGTGYGVTILANAGEVYEAIPLDVESNTWAIRANPNNSGIIYFGWDDNVSTGNGFPLQAGDNLSISLDNQEQQVYASAASAGDELRYIAVK